MDRQYRCRSGRRGRVARTFRGFGVPLALVLAGCAVSSTRFSSTWVDETYTGGAVEPVAVLGLFDSEAESRNFETDATDLLRSRGIQAVAGHSILEPGKRYSEEEMERQLKQRDIGGLLIFRLIGENTRHRYLNPTPFIGPVPPGVLRGDPFYWYYYPNWNYYWYWRSSLDVTRSPGYWAETTYYVIESSLYSNGSDRLLWTAKSETLDGSRLESVAESVAKRVGDELVGLGFLETGNELPALGAKGAAGSEAPGSG